MFLFRNQSTVARGKRKHSRSAPLMKLEDGSRKLHDDRPATKVGKWAVRNMLANMLKRTARFLHFNQKARLPSGENMTEKPIQCVKSEPSTDQIVQRIPGRREQSVSTTHTSVTNPHKSKPRAHRPPARKKLKSAAQECWSKGPISVRKQKKLFLQQIARQGGVAKVWSDWYTDIECEICNRSDAEDRMLLCDDCDCGFHMHCLRPILVSYPQGQWSCKGCREQQMRSVARAFAEEALNFQKNQASIRKYFQVSANPVVPRANSQNTIKAEGWLGRLPAAASPVRRVSNAHASKNRQCFRVAVPTRDATRRLMQLATFASAMKINNMVYVWTHKQRQVEQSDLHVRKH